MVTPRFLPDLGGIETHVAEVAPGLAGDGFDVTVLTTDRTGDLPATEVVRGVPVVRVPAWPAKRDWYAAPALVGAMRAAASDLVHVQGYHTLVPPLAMAAARWLGRPYVVSFHSGGSSSALRNRIRSAQRLALRPGFVGAARLIAVSRFELELFRRQLRLSRRRFVLIRNGSTMPPPADIAQERQPTVVSVGRLERYKGHHRLIEAWPAVLRSVPQARLEIVGSGPDEPALRSSIADRGLGNVVDITSRPPADRQAMSDLLGSASLFALLSDYEAHPVAVMESLSVGTPVLVATTSGLTELVDDGLATGIPRDAEPEVIGDVIARQLLAPSRVQFDLPTWDDTAAALGDCYRRVLSGGR